MAFVFDIIIIAIVVLCIFTCRKHGLVRSVIETTGGMVAAFVAYLFAKPAGLWLSSKLIKGLFAESAARSLISIEGSELSGKATEAISQIDIAKMVQDAPQALKDLLAAFNVDLSQVQSISDSKTTIAERAEAVVDAIVTPISEVTSICICFVLFFALLMVLVVFLAKLASTISYIPVVGKFNRFLGTLFGVIKAVAFVFIFTAMLDLLMPFIAEPMALDKSDPYANTLICKRVCDINPVIALLPELY